jgi:hypothetical protein
MPINATTTTVVPPIAAIDYPEWRQVKAVEEWTDPAGPIATTVVLRRCRRSDPNDPASTLVDMTTDQERLIKQTNPAFSRDVAFTVPDISAAAAENPIVAQAFAAKLAAIDAIGKSLGLL